MITKQLTLDHISSDNRALEPVIERLGFSKNSWDRSIEDLCVERDMNSDFVIQILNAFEGEENFPKESLSGFSLNLLLNYLKNTHAYYLNKKLPEIELTISNIKKHCDEPLYVILTDLFINYKEELVAHIENEEEQLFPYIDALMNFYEGKVSRITFENKFSGYSVSKFTSGHHDVEDQLAEIRKVIMDYVKVSKSPLPFNIFINQLLAFEQDLYRHALVEDLVVIPKAMELEKIRLNFRSLS